MLASQSAVALTGSGVATEADVRTDARLAGAGLLVALGSIVVLYGGSAAVAGTRPDNAATASAVIEFFAHPTLAIVFSQAVFSVFGLTFFAFAFRPYLRARAASAVTERIVDFGTGVLIIEMAVFIVVLGLQLALVRLSVLGDPSVFGVFLAWNWIDNGIMLWLEVAWVAALSFGALRSGGLPRWLAVLGLIIAALLATLAAPALLLGIRSASTLARTRRSWSGCC